MLGISTAWAGRQLPEERCPSEASRWIARPQGNADLVYKWPDRTIPMFSQCTVMADEWAVFSKEGRPVATLDAGRTTLSTANIPFLSNFVDQYTGGNFLVTDLFFRASHALPPEVWRHARRRDRPDDQHPYQGSLPRRVSAAGGESERLHPVLRDGQAPGDTRHLRLVCQRLLQHG